jgi:hypothetical protein
VHKLLAGLGALGAALFLTLGLAAARHGATLADPEPPPAATSFGSRLLVPPDPVEPARVLMLGDSLAVGVADYMQAAMDSYGNRVDFVSRGYLGASLFHSKVPEGIIHEIGGILDAEPDTDVVIAEFGGICWQPIMVFECATPDATKRWVAIQTQVVQEVRAHGMRILWAVTPTVGPDASDYRGWNEIQQATIENLNALGVPLIRWDHYVSQRGDGAFTPAMPLTFSSGESGWYDVREADGAHLTLDADRFLAEQTARDWWELTARHE